jgi:hypothetical protein
VSLTRIFAVDDPLGVGVLHGIGDLGDEFDTCGQVELERVGGVGEPLAAHVLHRKVLDGFVGDGGGARLVDARDARVFESAQNANLTAKAGKDRAGVMPAPNDLERNLTLGVALLGKIDDPHAALTDRARNAIGADVLWSIARLR